MFTWERIPFLVFAFVLSLCLYLFVQIQDAPSSSPTQVTVRIEARNLPKGLFARFDTKVPVTVDGPPDQVDQLTEDPSQAAALVDLSRAKAGLKTYMLSLGSPGNLPGVKLHLVRNYVKVNLVPITERIVPIEIQSSGAFQNRKIVLDKIELRPPTVTLQGPEDVIGTASAVVEIDLSTINPDKEFENKIKVLDGDKVKTTEVTADPENVVAAFATHNAPQQKQVIVNLAFTGKLPAGLSVDNFFCTPQAITVQGDSQTLASTATVTINLDLSKLASKSDFVINPVLPPGLKMVRPTPISVHVQVKKIGIGTPPQSGLPETSSPPVSTTGSSPPP